MMKVVVADMARYALCGLLFVIVLMAGSMASATAADRPQAMTPTAKTTCPKKQTVDRLLDLENLYFGETHGNAESPAFLSCIVHAAIARGWKPLYVSFELPPQARNLDDRIWSGQDGRTSVAFAQLMRELIPLEATGDLMLDFQLTDVSNDNEVVNRRIGEHLKAVASKGHMIAIGGSLHAQRRQAIAPMFTFTPAGAYTGKSIASVLLDTSAPGQTWACVQECGPHATDRYSKDAAPEGTLKDGDEYGFDYVLFLPAFSPSSPLMKK